MFFDVFRFELNFHRRQYLFYVLAGVFFLLTFLATTTPNVSMVGGVDNININAPYTVVATLASFSLMALFGAIAFCASGVLRDTELQVSELFLSTPITKFDYMYGRFAGALVFVFGLYLAGLGGILLGEFMPWLDAERIGDTHWGAYWFATWAIALPNLFLFCCVLFCVATVTRSMMAAYIAMVALLMLTFLLDTFTEKSTVELTSILDPFGTTALEEVTRYWTVFEKNSLVPALEGALLANRLLWMAVGAVFLALSYPAYTFSIEQRSWRRNSGPAEVNDPAPHRPRTLAAPPVHPNFDGKAQFAQFWSQAKLEIRNIVFSAPFVVLLLMGVFLVVANAFANLGNLFGTSVYPTTSIMVEIINGAFSLSLLAVLIYYSGELLARERSLGIAQLMDAMPYQNWVMMAAKITGLGTVIFGMLFVVMLAAIGVQLYKGFYDINILQYLQGLFFFFQFPLYLMIVMAVFFNVLTRSKYIAMFLMVLYFVYSIAAPQLGLEHYLYRMRQLYPMYSDFTGYGHNLLPYLWQTTYWGFFGCLLLIATHLMWPRGAEDNWGSRIKVMRQRTTQRVVLATWSFATLFVLSGAYIYYNTVILNEYVTRNERERQQAEYEKKYSQYEYKTQPAIDAVYAEIDIDPVNRDVRLRGNYEISNHADEPITEVHFVHWPWLGINELEIEGATLESFDAPLGYRIYQLDQPMQPGDARKVTFAVDWLTPGFANNGHSPKVTSNGTFFNNLDIFPLIGYRNDVELQDNNKRREQGLPPLERMRLIDDESAWDEVAFGSGNRVTFEAIVSTSPEQIALAPGYLEREWTEDGKRYFHYRMDAPIWNFYSFMSGDYKVVRDSWRDQVAIEVYYLHDYNVETMVRSVKNSLDYFTENFSPYQYRQFRILEFPQFQGTFAQSFPNTIPFSEAIGFTADLRDPSKIDYVYYVTAHELAHQWWAHQVLGADVQGQTMIVETLAQYSALMVMEQEYGESHMKRFLEYELDRYLQGRGSEMIGEMPLYLVENQPYIHYRKGSLVLYALKDYLGEARVNRALAAFIDEYAFKGAPYPTTRDLVRHIRAEATDAQQALITDLVERIVLFDLRAESASVTERPDGRFDVTFDVSARKYEADDSGLETEVPLSAWIDIGVFGAEQGEEKVPEVLYLEKREITDGAATFTVTLDSRPVSVGIDPLNKLIDRNPADNITRI